MLRMPRGRVAYRTVQNAVVEALRQRGIVERTLPVLHSVDIDVQRVDDAFAGDASKLRAFRLFAWDDATRTFRLVRDPVEPFVEEPISVYAKREKKQRKPTRHKKPSWAEYSVVSYGEGDGYTLAILRMPSYALPFRDILSTLKRKIRSLGHLAKSLKWIDAIDDNESGPTLRSVFEGKRSGLAEYALLAWNDKTESFDLVRGAETTRRA